VGGGIQNIPEWKKERTGGKLGRRSREENNGLRASNFGKAGKAEAKGQTALNREGDEGLRKPIRRGQSVNKQKMSKILIRKLNPRAKWGARDSASIEKKRKSEGKEGGPKKSGLKLANRLEKGLVEVFPPGVALKGPREGKKGRGGKRVQLVGSHQERRRDRLFQETTATTVTQSGLGLKEKRKNLV